MSQGREEKSRKKPFFL